MDNGEAFIMRNFIVYTAQLIIKLKIKYRIVRWAGHVARIKGNSSAFKILTRKRTGKRSPGRARRYWEGSIRVNFKEIGVNSRN